MATVVDLTDCLVIVIRNEETRLVVLKAFATEEDLARSVAWVMSQPHLFELVVRALRLEGCVDRHLDGLSKRAGSERGDAAAWLESWARLDPTERRRTIAAGR